MILNSADGAIGGTTDGWDTLARYSNVSFIIIIIHSDVDSIRKQFNLLYRPCELLRVNYCQDFNNSLVVIQEIQLRGTVNFDSDHSSC